jgi:hypothetical protein
VQKINSILLLLVFTQVIYAQKINAENFSGGFGMGTNILFNRYQLKAKIPNSFVFQFNTRLMIRYKHGIRLDFGYSNYHFDGLISPTKGLNIHVNYARVLSNLTKRSKNTKFGVILFTGLGYAAQWNKYIYAGQPEILHPQIGTVDEFFQMSASIVPQLKIGKRLSFYLENRFFGNFPQQQGFDFYDNDNIPKNNPHFGCYLQFTLGVNFYFGRIYHDFF